jgi:hypothetical protein
MNRIRLPAVVTDDRKLIVTLPPEVPSGPTEIDLVIREPQTGVPNGTASGPVQEGEPFFSLAQWFEGRSEHWGEAIRSDNVEGFTGRRY